MSPRKRILAFGSAAAVIVAGAVLGGTLAVALITIGCGGIVLLAFFEVGLSEDRERARDEERRRERARPRLEVRRRPRRPRGH